MGKAGGHDNSPQRIAGPPGRATASRRLSPAPELTAAQKDATSHRGKAVRAFVAWLKEQ